jgi:mannobiose 2-epimerase
MDLQQLIPELDNELTDILRFWMHNMPDLAQRGFYGRIDEHNQPDETAPKGAVLNARILWTFSAAYNYTPKPEYLAIADRAYEYIINYFVDKQYGGIYWSVDHKGNALDTKNQVYAIAFVIYALSEYHRCNNAAASKDLAIILYRLLQEHSYDSARGGYFEALTREWQPLQDLRLSAKDANEKKSMNTHLHVLEAYTNLYRIWPDQQLAFHIVLLLQYFDEHIINRHTHHLGLFFDENWQVRSDTISFGHDIEAAWLLYEAAEVIGHQELKEKMRNNSLLLAESVSEALDKDGGLWYEYENEKLIKEKHWWPQAEAMVGFFHAWQLSGYKEYLEAVLRNWQFIQQHIKDNQNGEWFWGVDDRNRVLPDQDKAGFWKCPYHNSRACLEIIKRASAMDRSLR